MDGQGKRVPFAARLSPAIREMDAAEAARATDAEGSGGAGQVSEPAPAPEAPGTGGSKSSDKSKQSSRKLPKDSSHTSNELEAVSRMMAAMLEAGVPPAAARPLARVEGVSLATLKQFNVTWGRRASWRSSAWS